MSENSSCDTDDVSDYGDEIPPEIVEAAKEVILNLLPDKSKRLYVSAYYNFKSWRSTKKTTLFVEDVFFGIFQRYIKNDFSANIMDSFLDAEIHHKNF